MISKLDPALWSCQILIFIINYFILLLLLTVFLSFCVPSPKRGFQWFQREISHMESVCRGILDWTLGPCLLFFHVWGLLQREGICPVAWIYCHLECLAKGFVLAAFFFFFFWNNGCFWESCKVGHCVYGLEKEDPEAGALPSPLRKDESWHSSPSSGLQTKRFFCFS